MQTILQTPTPNLQDSLDFYSKLNFKPIETDHPNLLSDGKVIIEINDDRYARAGVKLFQEDWGTIISQLESITTVLKTEEAYLLNDPSGAWIYLMRKAAKDYAIDQITASIIGDFAGISLEAIDIHKSLEIWQILGFKQTMGSIDQGWVSLANEEGMTVSIMKAKACPHLFFNPSVSYFNGKENLGIIAKVRAAGIPITEEISFFNQEGIVDNIIIRDPGGLGFFIFSD